MNALNVSSTPEVIPSLRPLVFTTQPGRYYWVEHGYGFVLKESQVAALVATFGRPTLP